VNFKQGVFVLEPYGEKRLLDFVSSYAKAKTILVSE